MDAVLKFIITNVCLEMLKIKRIYEPLSPHDGRRVLVDGLWPRGIARAAAAIDEWAKDIAPSPELRRWFGHQPERWPEFQARYRLELAEPARAARLAALRALAEAGPLTLLYAARGEDENNAAVLRDVIAGTPDRAGP